MVKKRRRKIVRRQVPKSAARQQKINLIKVGHYTFFIGLIIAVVAGLFRGLFSEVLLFTILGFLGLIVGVLNITMEETTEFLVASFTLIIAGNVLTRYPALGIGPYITSILANITIFVVPAAALVSLRAIWVLANKR